MRMRHVYLGHDKKVDFCAFERVIERVRERHQLEPYAGSFSCDALDDVSEQYDRNKVRQADSKTTVGFTRLERIPGRNGELDVEQSLPSWSGEIFRTWSWDKFASPHRKELVSEISAQSTNCRAHGRLTQVDAACCRREIALGHESIERDEEI
ncbi:hypothetical protein GCM10007857_67020 [Bradyrhizobium iriomotense]|uniref:Uncharacterized protein n=1 Tax=Bradyrhizobium iriomotense TaxID=441950 RepID=A0ABQ6B893_9BRAD|nr:hypothetical protein GCM10007857_67020 [Bradyrhizobium iriomotense]